jgi:hypothetical protein
MKVTIDSAEPLADALRVVGALYNVTLADIGEGTQPGSSAKSASTSGPAAGANGKPSRRVSASKPGGRAAARKPSRSATKATSVSTSDIRAWALASGHKVSDRGTLPAAVKSAYAEAHPS